MGFCCYKIHKGLKRREKEEGEERKGLKSADMYRVQLGGVCLEIEK